MQRRKVRLDNVSYSVNETSSSTPERIAVVLKSESLGTHDYI
jgi:hypothetical protein